MKWIAGVWAVSVLGLAGCNPTDAKELKRDATRIKATATRSLQNGQLALRVNAALADRKGVDMSGLHVDSEGGVITIGGHVRSEKERKTVVETINGVRGVENVVDNLRVVKK